MTDKIKYEPTYTGDIDDRSTEPRYKTDDLPNRTTQTQDESKND